MPGSAIRHYVTQYSAINSTNNVIPSAINIITYFTQNNFSFRSNSISFNRLICSFKNFWFTWVLLTSYTRYNPITRRSYHVPLKSMNNYFYVCLICFNDNRLLYKLLFFIFYLISYVESFKTIPPFILFGINLPGTFKPKVKSFNVLTIGSSL